MSYIANMKGPDFVSFYFFLSLITIILYAGLYKNKPIKIPLLLLSLLVIDGVGGYKLVVALSRGHSNVGYLLMIATISSLILVLISAELDWSSGGSGYSSSGGFYYHSCSSCSSSSSCSSCGSSCGGGCGGCGS